MSRIGKLPITIPAGVTVSVDAENVVTVSSNKGTLTQKVSKLIKKIGRANSTRIASVFSLGFVAIYLFGQGFWMFIVANLLYGISMATRNITDMEILSLSLKKLSPTCCKLGKLTSLNPSLSYKK